KSGFTFSTGIVAAVGDVFSVRATTIQTGGPMCMYLDRITVSEVNQPYDCPVLPQGVSLSATRRADLGLEPRRWWPLQLAIAPMQPSYQPRSAQPVCRSCP